MCKCLNLSEGIDSSRCNNNSNNNNGDVQNFNYSIKTRINLDPNCSFTLIIVVESHELES